MTILWIITMVRAILNAGSLRLFNSGPAHGLFADLREAYEFLRSTFFHLEFFYTLVEILNDVKR